MRALAPRQQIIDRGGSSALVLNVARVAEDFMKMLALGMRPKPEQLDDVGGGERHRPV